MNSITEDFKIWRNNSDGSCEFLNETGKSLAKFEGTIEPIGGYLYVYKGRIPYDIILDDGKLVLNEHQGSFPVLTR